MRTQTPREFTKEMADELIDRIIAKHSNDEDFSRDDITSIELPEGFEIIADHAFEQMFGLETVIIPEGYLAVGMFSFASDVNLRKVELPSTLQVIFEGAFLGCCRLKSVEFPDGLISIGERAFMSCASLRKLDIPGSVLVVHEDAFYKCRNVRKLRLHAGTEVIEFRAFGDLFKLWHFNYKKKLPSTLGPESRHSTAFVGSTCRRKFWREPIFKLRRYFGFEHRHRPYYYGVRY